VAAVGAAISGDSPQPTMKPAPAKVVTLRNVRRLVVASAARAKLEFFMAFILAA
jgi:hypothetical protein